MQKMFVSRTLIALGLFGIILLGVACGGDTPTSTPVPPTTNPPTALPPAPTAPPLTAAPTDVPTAVLPTATPPPPAATDVVPQTIAPTTAASSAPTNTTAASAGAAATKPAGRATAAPVLSNVDRGALNGLYVSKLRFEPGYPRNNDPVMFYATIINQTGKDQHYPVCVEIYRPDAAKPFGTSSCDTPTIVPNTSEVFAGYWTGTGIKECIPVRARPVLREEGEGETRLPFTRLNGAELWIDFNVCP
ncbi:MAG: hypothetical protein IT331_16045 [Anaerolineae bacterium]|nr:hypothetical protein [Anaerolineae bacterium]